MVVVDEISNMVLSLGIGNSEQQLSPDISPFIQIYGPNCSAWSRSQVRNQSIGPKQNTKLTVKPPAPPPTHLPKTFRRVPGFVRGQDLVCRLPIDQRAINPNFAPYLK